MRSRNTFKLESLGPAWCGPGLVAGVDEAGRGPLAGPVVAAAVILDQPQRIRGLADSKVLTPAQREKLSEQILARALSCSIASASVEEIDALNILGATLLAMRRAVEGLRLTPHRVVVDGNQRPRLPMLTATVVQGDARVASISAASILAKVHRDRLCLDLHAAHPGYGFDGHKGYATPEHLAALRRHGACAAHRRSFAPVRETFAPVQTTFLPPIEPASKELQVPMAVPTLAQTLAHATPSGPAAAPLPGWPPQATPETPHETPAP